MAEPWESGPPEYAEAEVVGGGKAVTDLVHIDTTTGEEIRVPEHQGTGGGEGPLALRDSTFAHTSMVPATEVQDQILRAHVNEKTEIDILPSGEIYMSHVHVRARLNAAYKPGGWALRPLSNTISDQRGDKVVYREWALMANGAVLATAFGSTKYQPNNARMDLADAAEAAKSNALTRCCKDLGIGSECWDRRFAARWRKKWAVHVWVKTYKRQGNQVFVDDMWRRIDADPFRGEFAIFTGSPNRDKFKELPVAETIDEAKAILGQNRTAPRRDAPPVGGGESTQARGGSAPVKTQQPPPHVEERNAPNVTAGSQHPEAKVDPTVAPYLIKSCTIHAQTSQGPLHKVITHSGAMYFTFSKRLYARAQMAFAAREAVKIEPESKKWGDKTMIAEIAAVNIPK